MYSWTCIWREEMVRIKELSSIAKGHLPEILKMREEGKSIYEIAEKVGVSKSTVYNWLRLWEQKENEEIE